MVKRMIKGMTGIIVLVLCVVCFTGCDQKDVEDQVRNVTDSVDEHVIGVKNGYPEAAPQITYGDAFENFFANPTWKYFGSTDGKDVVEFTGKCTYLDQEVKARLQFILSKDGKSFKQGALSFNDVPQSSLVTSALIFKAFASYAEDNDMELDSDLEDAFGSQTDLYYDEDGDLVDTDNLASDNQYSRKEEADNAEKNADDNDTVTNGDDEKEEDDCYLVPGGDGRYIKNIEIKYMNAKTLRLARNEFYARHGRKFTDPELQKYFNKQPWYKGTVEPEDFDESVFNKYEKKNIRKLAKAENR